MAKVVEPKTRDAFLIQQISYKSPVKPEIKKQVKAIISFNEDDLDVELYFI